MYSEEYKQQAYKKWLDNGRSWFSLDSSKDPSWEEKQIIIEIKKREAGVIDQDKKENNINEVKRFHETSNLDNY
jgi:hypothetical protein